jgi:DNA-binding MarR family transcriptional regulator
MKLEEAIKSNRFNDERHKATVNILYSAYWLRNSFSTALKEYDLTLEQHNVLRILKGSYPKALCVKEIASRIIEKSSNVPRIIDRLVTKKLVQRGQSKEDKRETLVSLTESGISMIDKARKLIERVTNDIININEEEGHLINELLEKIRQSSDK